jgi:hypothetical protein
LFMHFLGASRDGLVARRVDLDTISSSDISTIIFFSLSRLFSYASQIWPTEILSHKY